MTKWKTRLAAGLIAGSAIALSGEAATALQNNAAGVPSGPAVKDGWWIRVNPGNQADNLSWRFGPARNRLSTPIRWWKDQNPIEFDLPAAQRGVPTLHVAAIGLPYTQPVSFCLFFQNHGVQLFEFTAETTAQIAQGQQSPQCVP
jgi:hypothetical protein